jgi:CheY-like chemotaxis protein
MRPIEILLIEDNPAEVVLIWHVLAESDLKVKVHLAVDGEQALQMLTAFRTDLDSAGSEHPQDPRVEVA